MTDLHMAMAAGAAKVVDDGALVGIVSLRDLLKLASIRPAGEAAIDAPRGLKGVVVTDTALGVREGGELADLAPTCLELLGVRSPGVMSGRSLVSTP